jgi:hypothetical protein
MSPGLKPDSMSERILRTIILIIVGTWVGIASGPLATGQPKKRALKL